MGGGTLGQQSRQMVMPKGLSPRGRGNRGHTLRQSVITARKVYPRVGGGTLDPQYRPTVCFDETSTVYPRVGGATSPRKSSLGPGTGGSIPAWAGEPVSLRIPLRG